MLREIENSKYSKVKGFRIKHMRTEAISAHSPSIGEGSYKS
jgi:hypothetical protein